MRERRRNRGGWWAGAALILGVLAVPGCGDGDADAAARDGSSGFTVGAAPNGYQATVAGRGSTEQDWAADSGGGDQPYTVLSPDGTTDSEDVVVVSISGYEGEEGGLDSVVGRPLLEPEAFTVAGAEARFRPGGETELGTYWPELGVVKGDDLAVLVTSPSATRDELVAMVDLVEIPADRSSPPTVPDPPDGLRVVGSVDAAALLALRAFVSPNADVVPGTDAAHAVGWVGPEEAPSLSVLTLPGEAADLDALVVDGHVAGWNSAVVAEDLEVGGRPARSLETIEGDGSWWYRSVWVESEWNDLVVVTAVGPSAPSIDDLAALAETVEPVDDDRWEEFAVEVTGGAGLRPDPGRTELARGTIGDLEWLLQDAPQPDHVDGTVSDRTVDPCLKLSNRQRTCNPPAIGNGTADDWIHTTADGADGMPSFVVISTTLEAATITVTTHTDQASAELLPVPGGGVWAAIVFVDDPGQADGACDEGPALTAPPEAIYADMRVDALDADGQVIGCLGMGPGSYLGGI